MFVFVFIFCLLYLRLIPKSTNIKKDYNMALILINLFCFLIEFLFFTCIVFDYDSFNVRNERFHTYFT